jgi:hypothetical protein
MRKVSLFTLALVAAVGLAGCKKAPQSPKAPGNDMSAPAAMGTGGDMSTALKAGPVPASAAAACKKDAVRPGKIFGTKEYDVTVTAPAEAGQGKAVLAVITVTPKGGYKINMKYDHELALKRMSAGVKPERKTYENKHAAQRDKAGLKFVVKYTGSAAGVKVLQGVLDFSVCTPKLCVNKDDLCVSWESTVK